MRFVLPKYLRGKPYICQRAIIYVIVISQYESVLCFQANIKEISMTIPTKYHNSIIGAKGRLIQSVMQECGGVIIRFPPEGSHSDKVAIRGPKDDVENARKQLMELAAERVGFNLFNYYII